MITEINWGKLKDAKQNKKTKNYYAKIYNEDDDELLDGKNSDILCSTVLTPQSDLLKEASYVGAVTNGRQTIPQLSNENGVCECEAKVRAFMRMLRVKEGSEGQKGYTTLFTNKDFTKPPYNRDMSTHPKIVITAGGYSSSATGAYQIMQDTFKGFQGYYLDKNKNWQYSEKLNYIKQYKINSFDQESQDKLCIVILKHNYVGKRAHSFFYKEDGTPRAGRAKFNNAYGDIVQMIIDDDFDKVILTSSLCWASLPDAPYGQPTGTKAEC
ncbi:glycoside hydrolase family 24 protein [Chryseobacterium echinoideorum]|uniref:glycoside hydrolase family 24 protein n=1 Tax=Chryseobacterium echinoideorum TaxID=1549648 RepID=UPI0011861D73|nr:glycoside hydrolase family 104 protein [Chryseobacterium echinoideorum]